MKKIIRNGNSVIVVLDNGTILQNGSCNDALFAQLQACEDDNEVTMLLLPKLQEAFNKKKAAEELLDNIDNSKHLSKEGSSIYWRSISELSLPQNFAEKIVKAEINGDEDALESYKNFWTLLCLNPDERVRQNLFWYLDTWGMCISKSGLFVGYRNVDIHTKGGRDFYSQAFCDFVVEQYNFIKNSSPKNAVIDYWVVGSRYEEEEYVLLHSTEILTESAWNDVYDLENKYNLRDTYNELKAVNFIAKNIGDDTIFTDHYSRTLQIKIGEMVTMPREECDCDSDVECSRGLHLGGTRWLESCYFGVQGLACLCNPRDVVAVPHDANYGKLRTCAYLPVARVEYDALEHIIPLNVEDGFDSKWVKTILYDGIMSTEDSPTYKIDIPQIPEYNRPAITNQVLEIARKYMK